MGTGLANYVPVPVLNIYRNRLGALFFLAMVVLGLSLPSQSWANRGAKHQLKTNSSRNHAKNLASLKRRATTARSLRDGSSLGKSKAKVNSLLRTLDAKAKTPSKKSASSKKPATESRPTIATKTAKTSSTKTSSTKTKQRAHDATRSAAGERAKGVMERAGVLLKARPVIRLLRRASKTIGATLKTISRYPAVRYVSSRYIRARASITRYLSRVQTRAPRPISLALGKIRKYSPASLLGYMHHKLNSDKMFLGWYFAANTFVADVGLPAMVTLGLSTAVATTLYFVATPITVGVLVAREHILRKRAGKNETIQTTAISVLRDYQAFAGRRFDDVLTNAHASASREQ